jgi:hypothetical protein
MAGSARKGYDAREAFKLQEEARQHDAET